MKPSIRKVAALLASVDRATAERLLAKLPPDVARDALAAARKLGDLSETERRAAVEEFRRETGRSLSKGSRSSDSDDESQIELSISPQAKRLSESVGPPSPFRFLEEASDEELFACLQGENPQVLAVALTHLSPARGGKLLQELDDASRSAAMERFSTLDDSDAELARQAETEIVAHLGEKLAGMRKKSKRLDRLREILNAAGLAEQGVLPMRQELQAGGGRQSLVSVGRGQATSTERGQSPGSDDDCDVLPAFDDLPAEELARQFSRLFALPSGSLALLCGRASLSTFAEAMAGAEPEDAETFLAMLPKGEAQAFRERLREVFPLSLDRIERAQGELLALAGELADDGLI